MYGVTPPVASVCRSAGSEFVGFNCILDILAFHAPTFRCAALFPASRRVGLERGIEIVFLDRHIHRNRHIDSPCLRLMFQKRVHNFPWLRRGLSPTEGFESASEAAARNSSGVSLTKDNPADPLRPLRPDQILPPPSRRHGNRDCRFVLFPLATDRRIFFKGPGTFFQTRLVH